ncbi:MAG: sigma-70 family RNA polymerase sigma factor [Candidatus Paceibacterota bacterium]
MDDKDEKKLIEKIRMGDHSAFGMFYDHYVSRIYNFIYYKTHHKETAEDITSQTFYQALANIAQLDTNRSFSPWLYQIARNLVTDHYRKQSHRNHSDIEDVWDTSVADAGITIELDTDVKLTFEALKKHLDGLAPHEREVVMLRVWDELPYKEIAKIVGKSEGACKMSFSRSVALLRDALPMASYVVLLLKL